MYQELFCENINIIGENRFLWGQIWSNKLVTDYSHSSNCQREFYVKTHWFPSHTPLSSHHTLHSPACLLERLSFGFLNPASHWLASGLLLSIFSGFPIPKVQREGERETGTDLLVGRSLDLPDPLRHPLCMQWRGEGEAAAGELRSKKSWVWVGIKDIKEKPCVQNPEVFTLILLG